MILLYIGKKKKVITQKKMKSALAFLHKIIRIILARELAEHIVKNSTKQGKEKQK